MTIPAISELDLPDDALLQRILAAITAHPEIREPLMRALLTEEFLNLPTEVKELREEMREGFRAVNERIDENRRAINGLTGQMGEFRGESYERRCSERIGEVLIDYFDHATLADRIPIIRRMQDARRNGIITRREYESVRNVDIIAQEAVDGDNPERLAVVEATITFNRGDLQNAAERAELIGRLTGIPTTAFTVTRENWPEAVNDTAGELGVTIIQFR